MDSAVYYPAVLSSGIISQCKASLDHMSLTSKAYCQVNWKKQQKGPQRNSSNYNLLSFHNYYYNKYKFTMYLGKTNYQSFKFLVLTPIFRVSPKFLFFLTKLKSDPCSI